MRLPRLGKDTSLGETVYQAVYRQIVTGKLRPGARVTESSISGAMSISRAPVREALKRLAEDQLITFVPRKGCFVSKATPAQLEEIYEIRKRLECLALERAFDKLDHLELVALKKEFTECFNLTEPKLLKQELKLDAQLHQLIAQASGWPDLYEMLGKLRARIEVYRVRQSHSLRRADCALKQHLQILDALLAANKPQAVCCLEAHIESTKQNILKDHQS